MSSTLSDSSPASPPPQVLSEEALTAIRDRHAQMEEARQRQGGGRWPEHRDRGALLAHADALAATVAQQQEVVAAAHQYLRTALSLADDAPFRFDYYAATALALAARLREAEVSAERVRAFRLAEAKQLADADAEVVRLRVRLGEADRLAGLWAAECSAHRQTQAVLIQVQEYGAAQLATARTDALGEAAERMGERTGWPAQMSATDQADAERIAAELRNDYDLVEVCYGGLADDPQWSVRVAYCRRALASAAPTTTEDAPNAEG